ncbi:helix-turn-helix domain-containing protein [Pirellulaceae bacterium SH449]
MTPEERIQKAFGEKLRSAREKKGISQEKLALSAGLDRTYVNSVENGKRNISLCNIVRLAKALGITPKEFF